MGSLCLNNVSNIGSKKSIQIKDLNFKIEDKEFTVMTGLDTCGKSTVLKIIAGLEKISEGEVYIDDDIVNDLPYKKRDISMISSDFSLKNNKTVYNNLMIDLKPMDIPNNEKNNRIEEAADMLNLSHLLGRKLKALSEGQKQRVALARAVVKRPRVILIDDFIQTYDKKLRYQMVREIINIHKIMQPTMIYSVNNQFKIEDMNANVVVMQDGRILQEGLIKDIYNNPINLFVAGFVGNPQMNFIRTKIVSKRKKAILVMGEDSIILSDDKSNILKEKGYIGKEVIMGIRPEDIHYHEEFIKDHKTSTVKVTAENIESIEDNNFLYVSKGRNNFILKNNDLSEDDLGKDMNIAINESKIHIFDKETEASII